MSVNADQAELQKFSDLAQKWWDKDGEFKPLHQINPLRLQWIAANADISGKNILDVGCGGGILAESLAKNGATSVTGIDLAQASLEVATQHAIETGINNVCYKNISAEDFATQYEGTFDAITCMEMLEHVPDPRSIIKACSRLVKPSGWLFFSTLTRSPRSFFEAILGAEYLLNMVPRGTHSYAKFIKPSELTEWAQLDGLSAKNIAGISYNPLTKIFSVSAEVKVNYMMAFKKA